MGKNAVIELVREEMHERGWHAGDVAVRIVASQYALEVLALDLLLHCGQVTPGVVIGAETLASFDRVFGVSPGLFQRLYESPDPVGAVDPHNESTPG